MYSAKEIVTLTASSGDAAAGRRTERPSDAGKLFFCFGSGSGAASFSSSSCVPLPNFLRGEEAGEVPARRGEAKDLGARGVGDVEGADQVRDEGRDERRQDFDRG